MSTSSIFTKVTARLTRSAPLRFALWSSLACAGGALGIVACATDEDANPSEPPPNQAIPPGPDASVDQDAQVQGDAGCTDAAGCINTTDCSTVDFCATTYPVSRSIALNAVWGTSKDDVWAVGTRGTILHGDGTTFTSVPTNTAEIFFAVWGTGKNDVWFLNSTTPVHSQGFADGTATFEDVKGSSWNPNETASGRLWAGHSSAPDKVWIAGERTVRFADYWSNGGSFWRLGTDEDGGALWQRGENCELDMQCTPLVRALWGTSAGATPGVLWAVGAKGQSFLLEDPEAGRWSYRNPNTSNGLEGIWGTSATNVWAVGQNGTIRHIEDATGTWVPVESPTTSHLHGIWGSGPNDVWAVGDTGTVIHYDGKEWKVATIGLPPGDVPTNLFGVWGSGPDDVWIVGDGLILHRTAASRKNP